MLGPKQLPQDLRCADLETLLRESFVVLHRDVVRIVKDGHQLERHESIGGYEPYRSERSVELTAVIVDSPPCTSPMCDSGVLPRCPLCGRLRHCHPSDHYTDEWSHEAAEHLQATHLQAAQHQLQPQQMPPLQQELQQQLQPQQMLPIVADALDGNGEGSQENIQKVKKRLRNAVLQPRRARPEDCEYVS